MRIDKTMALDEIDRVLSRRKPGQLSSEDVAELNALFRAAIMRLAPRGSIYLVMMEKAFNPPQRRLSATSQDLWLEGLTGTLKALRADYEADMVQTKQESDIPAFVQIDKLLSRFHKVVKQLEKRHNDRVTITITDEYDVQDLLHALLRIDFDDIRPEERTPTVAGSSARIDFVLRKEQVVIEVKKTRDSLTPGKLGDELIIDIAKYKSYPDVRTLICFVYDPEERISNPVGIKHDLEKTSTETLAVVVYIAQH